MVGTLGLHTLQFDISFNSSTIVIPPTICNGIEGGGVPVATGTPPPRRPTRGPAGPYHGKLVPWEAVTANTASSSVKIAAR